MLIEPAIRSDILTGQTAIVTGGSRGIGGATAALLAANGANVVIADVDEAKAAEAVADIDDELGNGTASAFVADLVVPDACDRLVAHTLDAFGGIDIVVNNAGYAWDGGIHSMSDEQFQAMLDIRSAERSRLRKSVTSTQTER